MQQKTFRVEQMFGRTRGLHQAGAQSASHGAPRASMHDLAAVHETIKRSERELAALRNGTPLPRLQTELGAAISGMEEATQKILKSAEAIDESARTLSATLRDDFKRGLAHDVQEHVVRIYEASNFQDLAGQRISKAIATLQLIEQQIARLCEIWGGIDAHTPPANGKLVNGPKLADDAGHADQSEIDRMFA